METPNWLRGHFDPPGPILRSTFHVEDGRRPVERFERSLGEASESIRSRFYAENFINLMGQELPTFS